MILSPLRSWLRERLLAPPTAPASPRRLGGRGRVGDRDREIADLRADCARFEAVLDSMSDAVLAADGRGIVRVVNGAAMRMLGLVESPLGCPLEQVLARPELAGLVQRARRAGAVSLELDAPGPGPERRWLVQAGPGEGGVVVVLRDVTEVRRLERVRRDFVANVSHELRTPVAVVRANAETLLGGALEEPTAARRFVEAIDRHARRLTALTDDLLDIARIEAGRSDLELRPVAVAPLIEACVEGLRERARDRGLRMDVAVGPDAVALADERALEQILLNLLENAVRYNTSGRRVTVRAARSGPRLRIEVDDDGPGLPRAVQGRLFERFYRVDPGRSREQGGTGLGLAIVKNLSEAMGGRVHLISAPGEGATFVVDLPAGGDATG